jgi:hypothetical protein
MNARAVAIQGGLALVGLTAAYLTWQRKPELQAGETFIIDITKNELQKVVFEDEFNHNRVELTPAKDDSGDYISVLLTRPESDKNKPGPAAPVLLRGNDAAKTLHERFAPLRALRALGVLDAAKLKDLHLDDVKKHLIVTSRSGTRTFDMANPATGSNDVYLRDKADGRVFIIMRPILVDFSNAATTLIERRLHAFRVEEADRLTITAGAAQKELRITRTADGKGVELAPLATPDKPDTQSRAWHERVFALGVAEVYGKDEKFKDGEPVGRLRLEYSSRGRALGWLELADIPTPSESVSTGTPAKPALYARSELTTGWNKLSGSIEGVIAEGLKLVGAKP